MALDKNALKAKLKAIDPSQDDVIDKMVDYLNGNWTYKNGDVDTEPVWIVNRQNVNQYEGFLGH